MGTDSGIALRIFRQHQVLIGREAQLGALDEWLKQTSTGQRRLIFITGDPGTGKSVLLSTFLERARGAGINAIGSARCAQGYDAGEPLVPFTQAIRALGHHLDQRRVTDLLDRHAPAWLARLPDLIGDDRVATIRLKAQGATPARLRHELADALAAITQDEPVILAIDDVHWCDPQTVDLLGFLAQEGPARLLILATYRQVDAIANAHPIRTLALALQSRGLADEVSTDAFAPQQIVAYLQARFPQHAFPASFASALCESTSGNPALLAKLTDSLVKEEVIQSIRGEWRFRELDLATPDKLTLLRSLLDTHARTLGPVVRGRAPLRVGVLHSLTGMMAWTEMPVVDATLLAIEEINQRGGIRGHRIDVVVVDGQSTESTFGRQSEHLIRDEQVCTVFGCWTSASRKAARAVVERHDHLLLYPVQYEGMEQSPNIIYLGAAPNQQIIPAVRWAFGFLRKRRYFLIGWNSIYSLAANAIIRDEIEALGGEVVGEDYLPPNNTDVAPIVRKIATAKPELIFNSLVGDLNVLYTRALHSAMARHIPTVYFSIGELELLSLSASETSGDFAAWNYFQSLERPLNHAFVNRFRGRYGRQRVTADPMEAAYIGVHLWAQAVETADTAEPRLIRQALLGQTFEAPEGIVQVDPENQHLWKTFRLGRIIDGGQFDVIWSSEKPIRPEPYPPSRSREIWNTFLADWHDRLGGRWTKPSSSA